jgi:phosphatidylinositol alpha-1,6-mannosyltransferase
LPFYASSTPSPADTSPPFGSAPPFDGGGARIFLITHEFYPRHGGIATFSEEMARAAAGLGHEVEVWAPAAPAGTQEKPWPFRLRRLPLKGTHDLSCVTRLAREMVVQRRQLRYATVYLTEPGPMLAMMLLQFFPGSRPKNLILTFHGSEILRFHRNPLTRWLARRLIRRAVRISVLTGFTRTLLCGRFPEAASKIVVTPGAVRAGFADDAAPAAVRPHDRTIVLTVGRLHPRKGQHFVIEALLALPEAQRASVEYWLVGGHSKENYEERLRAAAGSSDLVVRFFGRVPDDELDRIYDRADIFAMTSVDHGHSIEGFGFVYLEAGAHGLPVVAHAVGGVPEAVADGVTGLLVPPDDRPALTAAFQRLLAEPELRRKLGNAGREWTRQNSWQHSAALLFGRRGTPRAAGSAPSRPAADSPPP